MSNQVEDMLDCLDIDGNMPGIYDLDRFNEIFYPSSHAHLKDADGVYFLRRITWMASQWMTETQHSPELIPENLGLRLAYDTTPLVSICNQLLENGADPNDVGEDGESLLTEIFSEVNSICIRIVQSLLFHGADPNHTNKCGETCLYFALESKWNDEGRRVEVTRTLLQHGANPNKPLGRIGLHKMPLERPCVTPDIHWLLRRYGAQTLDEYDADWKALRIIHSIRNLPDDVCKYILTFAFHSQSFYEELGCVDRVAYEDILSEGSRIYQQMFTN